MDEKLFRKKSIEKITSPEQLTDYIRVAKPSVWMVMIAILVLIAGFCVWGIFGEIDSKKQVAVVSDGSSVVCLIPDYVVQTMDDDATVRIDDEEYDLADANVNAIAVSEDIDDYARYVGDLDIGDWVYPFSIDAELPAGSYPASVIAERISPMSLIFN